MFKRILIANRGEIAVRIIRACRELGIESIAVYSDADRAALHVREADHAYPVGPAPAAESYLNTAKILEAAKRAQGRRGSSRLRLFLRARRICARRAEGRPHLDRSAARRDRADGRQGRGAQADVEGRSAGRAGLAGNARDRSRSRARSRKRSASRSWSRRRRAAAARACASSRTPKTSRRWCARSRARPNRHSATAAFTSRNFSSSRAISKCRCSPTRTATRSICSSANARSSGAIRRSSRNRRRRSSRRRCAPRWARSRCAQRKAVNYVSAGTIEFLADADRNFYFLEMNTRIQVEHPVTELVTGIDLVRTQIEIAAGAKLPFKQKDLAQRGWAIECRIYAEDPTAGFAPAPGKIETLRFPDGPGVRNDAGVYAGAEVPVFYDPMISKLAVWGADRDQAIDRMRRALGEFVISGELRTNLDFHRWIMTHPKFLKGDFDTNFINQEYHPNENGAAPQRRASWPRFSWPQSRRRRTPITATAPARSRSPRRARPHGGCSAGSTCCGDSRDYNRCATSRYLTATNTKSRLKNSPPTRSRSLSARIVSRPTCAKSARYRFR